MATKRKAVTITPLEEEVPQELSNILSAFDSNPVVEEEEIKVKSSKPKLVKVIALRKFNSSIGGSWYYGEVNKTMLVPVDVAELWLKDTKRPKIKVV